MNTFLEDQNGNKSSKRLWASILISCGILLGICFFITSCFFDFFFIKNSSYIIKIIEIFIFSGCGLLGISVFEFFKKG